MPTAGDCSSILLICESVGSAAREDHIGVVISIDEMQDLTEEQMSAVCRSCHRAGRANLPWFVIGGGLPNLPTRLAAADSYAERLFDYRSIDRRKGADALYTLTAPAIKQHVTWHANAAGFVLGESGGYPYLHPAVRQECLGRRRRAGRDHARRRHLRRRRATAATRSRPLRLALGTGGQSGRMAAFEVSDVPTPKRRVTR